MLHIAQPPATDFLYLGSPYTKYPAGRDQAFMRVCREAARLLTAGLNVYSPIAHSHPIAGFGEVDPVDHDLWVRFDKPMVAHAHGLIVLMMEGWEESRGLTHEIDEFKLAGKPVYYLPPGAPVRVEARL